MESFKYQFPLDLANRLEVTAKTNGMGSEVLVRRVLAAGLIIDRVEKSGGTTVIREDSKERLLRVVRDRSFCQRLIDRFGLEIFKKESGFSISYQGDLADEIGKIAARERMPVNRVFYELFTQGLNVADAINDPAKKVLMRNSDHSEEEIIFQRNF